MNESTIAALSIAASSGDDEDNFLEGDELESAIGVVSDRLRPRMEWSRAEFGIHALAYAAFENLVEMSDDSQAGDDFLTDALMECIANRATFTGHEP